MKNTIRIKTKNATGKLKNCIDKVKNEQAMLEKELDSYLKNNFESVSEVEDPYYNMQKDDILRMVKHFVELERGKVKDSMNICPNTEWDDINKFLRNNLEGDETLVIINKK